MYKKDLELQREWTRLTKKLEEIIGKLGEHHRRIASDDLRIHQGVERMQATHARVLTSIGGQAPKQSYAESRPEAKRRPGENRAVLGRMRSVTQRRIPLLAAYSSHRDRRRSSHPGDCDEPLACIARVERLRRKNKPLLTICKPV